mgnify:CR=1 FL=1
MNKSVVLKNKFYLFFSFLSSFFLFVYLLYFLVNGQKGVIKLFQLKNQNLTYLNNFNELMDENLYYADRIKRLQANTVDLDFLDEKLRKNTGLAEKNEIIVVFE